MPYVEYDEVEAVCSNCGRIFRSEEALELHRQDSHPLPLPEERARAKPKSGAHSAL